MKKTILAILIVLLCASVCSGEEIIYAKKKAAAASIAFDNFTGGAAEYQTSPLTLSHTTSTGANRLLVVLVYENYGSNTNVSGVTYGGEALTKKWGGDCISAFFFSMWYMVAPATGANNVVVSTTNTPNWFMAAAITYTGVNQSTPLGTENDICVWDNHPAATVSSATGEKVLSFGLRNVNTTILPYTAQTKRGQQGNPDETQLYVGDIDGASSVSTSWDTEGWQYSVAVPMKP